MEDGHDHDEEDGDTRAAGNVDNVTAKPKKRTRRRAPPPKHGNGTSCGSFVCAFILALLVIVALLGIAIYILQQKGYHLESSGTTTGSSDGDNIYTWLRGSTTPQHNSQPVDVYKAGAKDETENANEPDDSSSSSVSGSRGHNIEESTAEHPNEGLPLPATSHLQITSASHIPGVNVAVVNQPPPTSPKGVGESHGTMSSEAPDTPDETNGANGKEDGPSGVDNHSQVMSTPQPPTPEVKKTPSPTGNNKVQNAPTQVKQQQQQPTGSKTSPVAVMADDDALWQKEAAEAHGDSHPELDNSKAESSQPNIEDTTSKGTTKSDDAGSTTAAPAANPKADINSNDPPQSADEATKSNESQTDSVQQEEQKGSKSKSDSESVKQQKDDGGNQAKTDVPTKAVDEIGDDDALWKVEKTGNDPPP